MLIAWCRLTNRIFQVVASFEEIAFDKTRVIFKMFFKSAGQCNKVRGLAIEKNEENFDRLEGELRHTAKQK